MGIASAFRLVKAATSLSPVMSRPAPTTIRSPWSAGKLSSIVTADLFNVEDFPVTRAEAMRVPPVAKARHLVCGPISRLQLRQYDNGVLTEDQPAWLYRTDTEVHPTARILWSLDDLFFNGWSLWAVERDEAGAITDAIRVPPELWGFDTDGSVSIAGSPVEDPLSVLLFAGPHEGMLAMASEVIRGSRMLQRAWITRAKNPIPLVDLHQATDDELTDDEIDDVIEDWSDAREDPNGAVAYTPKAIEARALGVTDPQMFIEGRNGVRLDIANFANLPASQLDGSLATASLQYSTETGKRNEFIDYSMTLYMDPFEARLSMDDVSPKGLSIAFDLSTLATPDQSTAGPSRED